MRRWLLVLCLLSVLPHLPVPAAEPAAFESDPESPTLQALAEPLVVDESKYGSGPLLGPGKRYYVSLEGTTGPTVCRGQQLGGTFTSPWAS